MAYQAFQRPRSPIYNNSFNLIFVMLPMSGNTNKPQPVLAGFEKSLVDSSGHGVLSGRPFGAEIISPSATVYSSQIAGIPSPYMRTNKRWKSWLGQFRHLLAVIPCGLLPKFFLCASDLPDRTSENRRGAKVASLGQPSVFSKACQG